MTPLRPLASNRPWTDECEDLARIAATGYYFPGADQDDVLQEARIGVAKALRDWAPSGGSHFRTFALLCARRQVLTTLKLSQAGKHRSLNDAKSLDEPVGRYDAGDDVGTLGDLLWRDGDDPADIVIARDELRRLFARFSRLTPWEREVVERVRLLGEPYDTVGDRKRVDNGLQRAHKKLTDDTPEHDPPGRRVVYVDRTIHRTERMATAAAMRVCTGDVIAITKRKLIDGRERAPQGRPDNRGRRGQPVWRVDIQDRAA